jgi:hypothetical protein
MIEEQSQKHAAAMALEMEIGGLVGEIIQPLYGHPAVPILTALRIVVSHCLRNIVDDPADGLQRFIVDLNAAMDEKSMRAN